MSNKEPISEHVSLCKDGKYRWIYSMNLLKNPTILLIVWRIFLFMLLGIFAFVFIFDAKLGLERFLMNLKAFGIALGVMTIVVILGYLLYTAIIGGKYIVEFEMDENGVNHKQVASQAKKAKRIGKTVAGVGAITGNVSMVGTGINSQRTEMYSDFKHVKRVLAFQHFNLIKVNAPLNHNQVYASKEDFDFVKNYILSHCPNIKKKPHHDDQMDNKK